MIPPNVLQALRFLFKVGYTIGPVPLKWETTENVVKITKSVRRRRVALFISIYCFWNFCFMSVRWLQAVMSEHISYGKLFMNLYNIITHAGGSAFYLTTYLYGHEVEAFIFHLMKTNDHFRKFVSSHNYKAAHVGGNIIKRVILPIYGYSLLQSVMTIKKIDNPKYLWSLFNLAQTAKWKLIPLGLFESYMSVCLGTNLLLYVYIVIAYVRSALACLEILQTQPLPVIVKHYRQLQILNTLFHNLVKTMVLPFTTFILLSLTSLGMYATIKLHEEVKMPGYLGFPLITIATFLISKDAYPQSAHVNELAQLLIRKNIEFAVRGKKNFKILRSCPPLKVHIGDFYGVVHSTFFTFMSIVIDATINAMLTF